MNKWDKSLKEIHKAVGDQWAYLMNKPTSTSTNKMVFNYILSITKNNSARVMEIGTAAGDTTRDLLDLASAHFSLPESSCTVYACDPFVDYAEKITRDNQKGYEDYCERFKSEIESGRLVFERKKSSQFLKELSIDPSNLESFDMIYIDGAHDSWSVMEDTILAYPLLKKGGMLVYDDVDWKPRKEDKPNITPADCPFPSISFVRNYSYDKLHYIGSVPLLNAANGTVQTTNFYPANKLAAFIKIP
jgi:predicted O-methyltransferase YrrM